LVASACAGAAYVVPVVRPGALAIASSLLAERGAVFVQAPGMPRPIYLSRQGGGEPTAVLASCTHRGCQPEPEGERLVCPCHGSEFAFDGALLRGPAELPLTRYRVTEEGEDLIVWLEGDPR
jgi:Rieske Fe-S protein